MSYPLEFGPTQLNGDLSEMETAGTVLGISKIPELPDGFFNAAAWSDNVDSTVLLGRYVTGRGEPGQPDIGSLAMTTIRDGAASPLTIVWTPEEGKKGDLLEDPRVAVGDDGLIFGTTRLSMDGHYKPYPAFCNATMAEILETGFPGTRYAVDSRESPDMVHLTPGKNGTPLGVSDYFMYRKETDDHRFVVSRLSSEDHIELPYYVTIPEDQIPDWGTRRMGTTMPPTWLNSSEAVILLHGIKMEANETRRWKLPRRTEVGNSRYIYSIGSARLFFGEDEKLSIDNISPEAHLTPDSFGQIFPGEQVELRPEERRAVYLCGGVAVSKNTVPRFIRTYPNVGDTRTVEATFSVASIMANWRKP